MNNLPNKNSNNLSNQLTKEILNPSIDLSIDYTEIFIDDFINNETLSEIPIVKSVVGVIRTGVSINQFFFAKKLLTFIKEFNNGTIDRDKKEIFQKRISEDEKYKKRVTEQIMIFLDRFIEISKAKISANLLKGYVEEKNSYAQLTSLNISLERLHPESFNFIEELADLNFEIGHEFKGQRKFDSESLLLISGLATETSSYWHGFKLKDEGKLLYELGLKPLQNEKNAR